MRNLKKTLESRIFSTLKMHPDMTFTEASDLTLRSIGVFATLPSRTATIGQRSSAMAKQRIEPMAED